MQAVWNDSLTFCIFWWFCPDGQPRSTATTLLLPRLKRRGREQSMPERKRLTAWGKDDSIKAERMRQTNKQASKGHAEAKRVGKEQSCCTSHQWATLSQELIFSPVKKKLVIRWHLKYMQNNNNNKWICPWELLSVMDQQELWLLLDHSPAWSQPITSTRVKALNTAPKNYRKRAGFTEKKNKLLPMGFLANLKTKEISIFSMAFSKLSNRPGLLCALWGSPIRPLCSTALALYYMLGILC